MTFRFLLDTNILIEPTKLKPDFRILSRIDRHRREVCTAAPVWHEMLYGCHRLPDSKRRRQLETYLLEVLAPSLEVLPYDSRAAAWHAEERARLSAAGLTSAFTDGQIAAIAKIHGLVLVTRNRQDFVNFDGLSLEGWA